MFDSSRPPLLVQPADMRQTTLFPSHEGYNVHFISNDLALVGYRDGWTFPLSVQQQKYVDKAPLLTVRNSGGVTTSSSTFNKGYAHYFCREDGQELEYQIKEAIFPDRPDVYWMLVQDAVTMIWLQYGNKNQYCGGSGFDMERIYYGKLLIRRFTIKEDYAPRFDKHADAATLNDKQYRVETVQLFNGAWSEADKEPEKHLREMLSANSLDRYQSAVLAALATASGQE